MHITSIIRSVTIRAINNSKFSLLPLAVQKPFLQFQCLNAALPTTFNKFAHDDASKKAKKTGLMEFFDDEINWGEDQVKVGRSWRVDELRLKSNSDLHKLWFVLLKEKNMLLTMEHECNDQVKLFPNPERIDKVQDSMANLETVVRERNQAYHKLETGEKGERPVQLVESQLGLKYVYKTREHVMPKFMNTSYNSKVKFGAQQHEVKDLLPYLYERLWSDKRKKRKRDFNHVAMLFKRFPNMDVEAVKAEYPDVDVEKARKTRRAQGHFVPK